MQGEEENEQAERNGEGPVIHSNNAAFLLMMHKDRTDTFFLLILLIKIICIKFLSWLRKALWKPTLKSEFPKISVKTTHLIPQKIEVLFLTT